MATNQVWEQLINYEVFCDGARIPLGIASTELPEISWITQEISGTGIAGKLEANTLGHLESLELKLTFRALYEKPVVFLEQRAIILSLRGAQQQYDAGTGILKPVPIRIDARGRVKSGSLGSFEPAELTNPEVTFECDVIGVYVDNKELFFHDKYNFVARVNGKDYLAEVRAALGI